MLLSQEEVDARLSSPLNLINRLSRSGTRSNEMSLFGIPSNRVNQEPAAILSVPPSIDTLIDNVASRINIGVAKESALSLMVDSMSQLKQRLPEVEKARDLSSIASDMHRIVSSINQNKESGSRNQNQIIIYKPVIMNESHYEVVHANE